MLEKARMKKLKDKDVRKSAKITQLASALEDHILRN